MIRVVAAAIVKDGRVLAARKGPGHPRAGLWELPGGKVEPGEADDEALVREIDEELGMRVGVGPFLGESTHAYADVHVVLAAYACTPAGGSPAPVEHDLLRWLAADELAGLDWAPADIPLLGALAEHLRRTS